MKKTKSLKTLLKNTACIVWLWRGFEKHHKKKPHPTITPTIGDYQHRPHKEKKR
ncbi:hypothetical protein JT195_04965 [Helicobacter pylori]|nr:hypothetical protein [Helicobacter pylori]